MEEAEERAREEMEGQSPLQKAETLDALGKPSPDTNGHPESSGSLGPALCEVQTSSNGVFKQVTS